MVAHLKMPNSLVLAYRKLSVMKQLQKQQSTAHDQLKTEYEELWDPDVILETLEEHLQDPFDAKRLLTEMFMV